MIPNYLLEELDREAKHLKLSEPQKKKALEEVEHHYEEAKIDPGEAIGIITAESFGEPSTQMTMRSFHFAGVAEMNVTVGLPRLIEIFDARKTPSTPKMEMPLKAKHTRNLDSVREVAIAIKETKLEDVAGGIMINVAKKSIDIDLDRKKCQEQNLKPKEIQEKMKASLKTLIFKEGSSPYSFSIKVKEKEIPLTEVYKVKGKIKATVISGIKGITHVLPVKDEAGTFIIHCAGSNLKDALNLEEVDQTQIITNNIFEIQEQLGIEAARAAIIIEAKKVLEGQGLDIDMRHIVLLADSMTRTGIIKGVTRTGITGEKESVLARASFETPIKHIIAASLVGEKDNLNSVIENIMLNQEIPVGTGLPGLIARVKDQREKE